MNKKNNQNPILKEKIHTGMIVFSPVFGDGTITSVLEDGFYVKFSTCQFVYDNNGRLHPSGKEQSIFLK